MNSEGQLIMELKTTTKLQNTLFIDDNLDVMSRIPVNSVDLIATDPPFNTAKLRSSKVARYSDAWQLGKRFTASLEDKIDQYLISRQRKSQLKALLTLMQTGDLNQGEPTADRSFIAFMIPRALEMHRILKDTGSLYWQCDTTMSPAIKLMLDIIFGRSNFKNEIIWLYGKMNNASRNYPSNHDNILFYSKSSKYIFNTLKKEDSEYKTRWLKYVRDNKIVYGDLKHKADKMINLRVAKVAKSLGRDLKDDDVLFDFNKEFKALDNNWYISIIKGNAKERTGYPTQKPLKLFERIIQASSKEGQLVLDPFCGCATTPIAALKLGRNFIGIDVNGTAMRLIQQRLERETEQGNLNSHRIKINYVVNKQLLQDSIADINQLITVNSQRLVALGQRPLITSATRDKALLKTAKQFSSLDKKIETLELDRSFLQAQLKQNYPDAVAYLPELKHFYFKSEPELTDKEKQAWKREQLKLNRTLDKTYECPGYYVSGRHVQCLTLTEDGAYPLANMTTIEIDRIVPASMGGKYTLGNIQAICNKCNRTKKAALIYGRYNLIYYR